MVSGSPRLSDPKTRNPSEDNGGAGNGSASASALFGSEQGKKMRRVVAAGTDCSPTHPLRLPIRDSLSYISLMQLEISDEQAELLARELRDLIDGDRYFLSPRVRTLQEILDMIRPPPVREPPPPLKLYEPPRGGRYARRR
jgi:hypothetical protein